MKEKIIQTAVDLVQEYGVKFTLSDIASNAGISKKTIYKYFDSKEALLRAVVDYVFEDIRRQHQKILKQDLPNVEKLKQTNSRLTISVALFCMLFIRITHSI